MKAETKPMPSLRSDAEAEEFVETADLSEYDLSGFKPMRFEVERPGPSPSWHRPSAST